MIANLYRKKTKTLIHAFDIQPKMNVENATEDIPEIVCWEIKSEHRNAFFVLRGLQYNDHANRYELKYEEAGKIWMEV